MQYDLSEGHQLLNRLSVLFDYVNKCNARINDRYQIVNDLIDFITIDICINDGFTYDNANAPQAFYTNQSLKLPKIELPTARLLQTTWQQIIDDLKITTAQQFIQDHDQLTTRQLVQLSRYPKRYLKLITADQFRWLTLSDLNPKLTQKFNAELLQHLVHTPPAASKTPKNADQITRQTQPNAGLNYHFTDTATWVANQRKNAKSD